MARILLYTFFLLAFLYDCTAFGWDNTIHIGAKIGEQALIGYAHRPISGCEAFYTFENTTISYDYYPYDNPSSPFKHHGNRYSCSFELVEIPPYYGNWTFRLKKGGLFGTYSDHYVAFYEIKKAEILPSSQIIAGKDETIKVHLNVPYKQNALCRLSYLDEKVYESKNDWKKEMNDVKRFGVCGFEFSSTLRGRGTWTILYRYGNTQTTADFTIEISDDKNKTTSTTYYHKTWYLNATRFFTMTSHDTDECELIRPNGISLASPVGNCDFIIYQVQPTDEGNWTARYVMGHNILPIEETYIVKVEATPVIDVTVVNIDNSIIMSVTTSVNKLTRCTFKREEYGIINRNQNDRYEYFVNGDEYSQTEEKVKCGLTIHNVTEKDFGTWYCVMKIDDNLISTPIYVEKNEQNLL